MSDRKTLGEERNYQKSGGGRVNSGGLNHLSPALAAQSLLVLVYFHSLVLLLSSEFYELPYFLAIHSFC